MDAALRRELRRRAGNRCEYCRLPQEAVPTVTLQVEHVIPKQHGGDDQESNLGSIVSPL